MSNYLCKTCKSNNNGWCSVRKCNNLRKLNLSSCNTYESRASKIIEEVKILKPSYPRPPKLNFLDQQKPENNIYLKSKKNDSNNGAHRVLGKREMLWHIQSQIVGINEDITDCEEKFDVLVDCVKSLGTHLEFEEKLWEVENILDSEIDRDMIKDSKYINKNLL